MENKYTANAEIFKALADPNRLMILDMLSCGEMCACKILEKFQITQPTLSHHMKYLCQSGLVNSKKVGKWTHYSLNQDTIQEFSQFIQAITTPTTDCICHKEGATCTD